jgi:hypothetical protein
MLVRSEDFEVHTHPVLLEPGLPDEMKQHFREMGMAPSLNRVEMLEIVDECFHCGEKLTTPYVYWQGDPKGLSVHTQCAMKMALGLLQDVYESSKGQRAESERDAAKWLDLFASKKEYGVEGEEVES